MRKPVRPEYKTRRPPRGPRNPRLRLTPMFWIVFGAIVAVGLIVIIVINLWPNPETEPSPTSVMPITETIEATATFLPATETPIPLPTATPIPCEILRDTQAHLEPQKVTIKEPLEAGRQVFVTGKIYQEEILWYEIIVSGVQRYVPAEDVSCPVAP